MISSEELMALKGRIADYLIGRCGVADPRRNFRCLNPAHRDSTASMNLNADGLSVHCYGCGVTWDVFDLAGMFEPGVSEHSAFAEKVGAVSSFFGGSADLNTARRPLAVQAPSQARTPGAIDPEGIYRAYERLFDNEGAMGYLAKRGITEKAISRFGIGWTDRPEEVHAQSGYRNGADGFITLPYIESGHNGEAVYTYCEFRRVNYAGNAKAMKPKGLQQPIFQQHLLRAGVGELYVAEGVFDAISLWILYGGGGWNGSRYSELRVCALGGSGNAARLVGTVAEAEKGRRPVCIVFAPDYKDGSPDDGSARVIKSLQSELPSLGVSFKIMAPWPDGAHDANEYLASRYSSGDTR